MKRIEMRAVMVVALLPVVAACAVTRESHSRTSQNLDVLLTPVMIDAGLDSGMSFMPATLKTNILDLDKMLKQAKAVSLDDAYKVTFGVGLQHPDVNPRTGDVMRQAGEYGLYKYGALDRAQAAFSRLLVQQGIPEAKAQHYVLVGNYKWAWDRDQIIFAVSYRHSGMEPIRVIDKRTGKVTKLSPGDTAWNEAFQRDVEGQPVDEIVDWAAVSYSSLRADRVVATLFVIGVEAVKKQKRSTDFWPAEGRWLAGETDAIMQESSDRVKRALVRN